MDPELHHPSRHPLTLLFDWRTDVERLEREASAAQEIGEPNDLALVDAECSLDLIDADLRAAQSSNIELETTAETVRRLTECRDRIAWVIEKLRELSPETFELPD